MPDYEDPLLSFHFALEVQGKLQGLFTHVGGLGSESEVAEQKVVNEKGLPFVQKVPGRLKWTPITLKRGITKTMDIWTWRKEVTDGDMKKARADASLIAFDSTGTEVARWNMTRAWPSKVTGPEFDSTTGNVMFEEVTIEFESVIRVT